jgi:hypothetical protein
MKIEDAIMSVLPKDHSIFYAEAGCRANRLRVLARALAEPPVR